MQQEALVERPIEIKGIRDGLLISVADLPGVDLYEQLASELDEKQAFLAGGRIAVEIGHRKLDKQAVEALQALFEKHALTLWAILAKDQKSREAARSVGLATRISGTATDLDGNRLAGVVVNDDADTLPERALPDASALLLRETVRSGRSVFYEGDIVVIGDVNAGAEVVAGGSVIVWGRLRGLVHAGAMGDTDALICALELTPTQLRIADQIAVDPDNGRAQDAMPEQASIRNGQIVAEPWPARHS